MESRGAGCSLGHCGTLLWGTASIQPSAEHMRDFYLLIHGGYLVLSRLQLLLRLSSGVNVFGNWGIELFSWDTQLTVGMFSTWLSRPVGLNQEG